MQTIHPPLEIFQKALTRRFGCLFCNPVEGMEVLSTPHFRVLMDTFPIIPGHLLISSKDHYGSAGEIPLELQKELLDLKQMIQTKILSLNGHYTFYEHGRAGSCMSSDPFKQKCEHFHLHCLPINASIHNLLLANFDGIVMNHYDEISNLFLKHGNYLYTETSSSEMYFFPLEGKEIAPHLLRTLICKELQVEHRSNWEIYNESDLFEKSHNLIITSLFNSSEEIL
jgi:diadenosine tetraphosphate (Ap4A) HIT family hydrolase